MLFGINLPADRTREHSVIPMTPFGMALIFPVTERQRKQPPHQVDQTVIRKKISPAKQNNEKRYIDEIKPNAIEVSADGIKDQSRGGLV